MVGAASGNRRQRLGGTGDLDFHRASGPSPDCPWSPADFLWLSFPPKDGRPVRPDRRVCGANRQEHHPEVVRQSFGSHLVPMPISSRPLRIPAAPSLYPQIAGFRRTDQATKSAMPRLAAIGIGFPLVKEGRTRGCGGLGTARRGGEAATTGAGKATLRGRDRV